MNNSVGSMKKFVVVIECQSRVRLGHRKSLGLVSFGLSNFLSFEFTTIKHLPRSEAAGNGTLLLRVEVHRDVKFSQPC